MLKITLTATMVVLDVDGCVATAAGGGRGGGGFFFFFFFFWYAGDEFLLGLEDAGFVPESDVETEVEMPSSSS